MALGVNIMSHTPQRRNYFAPAPLLRAGAAMLSGAHTVKKTMTRLPSFAAASSRVPYRAAAPSARIAAIAALAAAASLLAGCERAQSQPKGGGMPAPEVAVVTVQRQSVPASFEYVGQTAGSREVEVRARVTGIIEKRNFPEGGSVVQGQSMYTLDPAPYQVAVARAEALLASADARLQQAQRNAARLKPLFEA